MNNLKPCPFCRGNVTYTQNDITGEHHIECLQCAVLVLFDVNLPKDDVIAHWNTRVSTLNPHQNREERHCNTCSQTWINTGVQRCPFCLSLNTHIVEEEQW